MPKQVGRVKLVHRAIYDDESTAGKVMLKQATQDDTRFYVSTDNGGVLRIENAIVVVRGGDKESDEFRVVAQGVRGADRGWVYASADPAVLPVGEVSRSPLLIKHRPRIVAVAGVGSVAIAGIATGGYPLGGNRVRRDGGSTGQIDVILSTDNPAVNRFDPAFVTIPSGSDYSQYFVIYTISEQSPSFGYVYGSSAQGFIMEAELEVS